MNVLYITQNVLYNTQNSYRMCIASLFILLFYLNSRKSKSNKDTEVNYKF